MSLVLLGALAVGVGYCGKRTVRSSNKRKVQGEPRVSGAQGEPRVSGAQALCSLLCDSFQSDILFIAVCLTLPLPPPGKLLLTPLTVRLQCMLPLLAPFPAPLACPLPSCVVLSPPLSVTSWIQLFWLCSYLSTVFQTHHVMSCEEPKLKALATL